MRSKKFLLSLTFLLGGIFLFTSSSTKAFNVPFDQQLKKYWKHLFPKPHYGVTRFQVNTEFSRYDHQNSIMAKNQFFIFISYSQDFTQCHFQISHAQNPKNFRGRDHKTYPCHFSKSEENEYRRFFTVLNFDSFSEVLKSRYSEFWSKRSYKNPHIKPKRRRHNEKMVKDILSSEKAKSESKLKSLEKYHLYQFPTEEREFYLWNPDHKSSLGFKFSNFKTI